MNILVTGGAGFIGSNFVLYMLSQHPDCRITNADVLTYAGNLENVAGAEFNPRYRFVKADITDAAAIDAILQADSFDAIINFAAESHVDRSITDPGVFIKTNVMGTQVLLDAAKKFRVGKFVQISTDEVYGSLGPTGLFSETTPLSPNSPYSASKAGGDMIVKAYHETYGMHVNITRCSNNYGPYHFPEKLIPLMITNALQDQPLPIYGDGLQIRDWLYVEDHCRAIDLVLHRGASGEVYNVGGRNERTNIAIVKRILAALDKPETLIRHVQDRPGHDRRYGIDASKIEKDLGWKPIYDFEAGMEKTIRWYLEHREWWSRVKTGAYMSYYEEQYGVQPGSKQ